MESTLELKVQQTIYVKLSDGKTITLNQILKKGRIFLIKAKIERVERIAPSKQRLFSSPPEQHPHTELDE